MVLRGKKICDTTNTMGSMVTYRPGSLMMSEPTGACLGMVVAWLKNLIFLGKTVFDEGDYGAAALFQGFFRVMAKRRQSSMEDGRFVRRDGSQDGRPALDRLLEAQSLRVDFSNEFEGDSEDAPQVILQSPGLQWICIVENHALGVSYHGPPLHLFEPCKGVYEYINTEIFAEDLEELVLLDFLALEVKLLPVVAE